MPTRPPELDELGRLIRDARAKLDLTQDAAARLLDIRQPYLSALERGRGRVSNIGSKLLVRMADQLGIDENALARAAFARVHAASGKRYDTNDTDISVGDTTAGAA